MNLHKDRISFNYKDPLGRGLFRYVLQKNTKVCRGASPQTVRQLGAAKEMLLSAPWVRPHVKNENENLELNFGAKKSVQRTIYMLNLSDMPCLTSARSWRGRRWQRAPLPTRHLHSVLVVPVCLSPFLLNP